MTVPADAGGHRRLGRPPAASGEETRQRLLQSARQCFAEYGYAGTSNRHVAERSGLTTGAIYHYFSSKRELYIAAHQGLQEMIYSRFAEAIEGKANLLDELSAVLEESGHLNREDPSLAGFLVARRTDAHRYPELAGLADEPHHRLRFFGGMLDRAIGRGELRPEHRQGVLDVIRVITTGLVFAASDDLELQVASIDALVKLLRGVLLAPPA